MPRHTQAAKHWSAERVECQGPEILGGGSLGREVAILATMCFYACERDGNAVGVQELIFSQRGNQ